MKVTPCSAMASRTASGWNRPVRTSVVSVSSEMAALTTAPVMWNSGAMASTTSPSRRLVHVPKVATTLRTLPWVFIAPFGGPVVPEV